VLLRFVEPAPVALTTPAALTVATLELEVDHVEAHSVLVTGTAKVGPMVGARFSALPHSMYGSPIGLQPT
jgi:hypothetical protein